MNEVLDFYQQQAKANISSSPWLAEIQLNALGDFKRQGFPTRHDEEWKYTILDSFLQQQFSAPAVTQSDAFSNQAACYDLAVGKNVYLHNGQILNEESWPDGVVVKPLLQMLQQDQELIKPYLGQMLKTEHGFHALNTAMINQGIVIYLPKGVRIAEPIVINHWQDIQNQAMHIRHLIIAEEGSEAAIIELYQGKDCGYFTNTITEIAMAARSKIIHYKLQKESLHAIHVGHVFVKQEQASQFESHSLSLGGQIVRSDYSISLQQDHAKCLLNGLYLPDNNQHIDHHTKVSHQVPECHSEQDYKGILMGRSRAVFNGKVIVAKNAQHTQAQQQNKNLLLSNQAEVDTKPQLEIFADDVMCSHGATVGQLDEDAIFYLTTRGIDRSEACRYLIHAFATNNLSLVPHKQIADWMASQINKQLK